MTTESAFPAGEGREEELAWDLAVASLHLARAFSRGATLWCVAPQWPFHAHHLAVEFVHPVIMGKRALPAVAIENGILSSLRLLAKPDDVLLAVGGGDETLTLDVLRRTRAWGLRSMWIGAGRAGERPTPGMADDLLWLDGIEMPLAARSGELVLLYHLLWELTHVVFEHPGLLSTGDEPAGATCVTCSDDAQLAEVRAFGDAETVEVVAAGRTQTIDGSLLGSVAVGDLVLVHGGVAISTIAESPEGGVAP